jgi:hypothetical protein
MSSSMSISILTKIDLDIDLKSFFRNRNVLETASATPTIYSVSDSIVSFTPVLTPCSRSSLSYSQKVMRFFRNQNTLTLPSEDPTIYSVSDSL